jgi:predicted alpha/beta-fold hydrolase
VKDIALSRWASLYDFDEVYTGPVAGFGTREKYYDLCSANRYLKNVKIPTYMMTAADDPFIDVSAYREAEISPNVIRHIEEHGGHLGYFSGSPTSYGTRRWLDYALWKLLNEVV